jgi:hypothetical protein
VTEEVRLFRNQENGAQFWSSSFFSFYWRWDFTVSVEMVTSLVVRRRRGGGGGGGGGGGEEERGFRKKEGFNPRWDFFFV